MKCFRASLTTASDHGIPHDGRRIVAPVYHPFTATRVKRVVGVNRSTYTVCIKLSEDKLLKISLKKNPEPDDPRLYLKLLSLGRHFPAPSFLPFPHSR